MMRRALSPAHGKGRVIEHRHRFAAGLAIALLSAGAPAHAAEKTIGLTSFEEIVVSGDFVVEVVTASPLRAVVTGSTVALDRVEVRSSGGILTISDKRYASNRERGANIGAVTIRVNAARVRAATLTGAGSLTIDRITGAAVALKLRGPGALTVRNIAADRMALAVVGNGKVTLAGTIKSGAANVSGAAVVDASALKTTDLTVTSEGAGDQQYQASRSAQGQMRGIGRVQISGKAKCTIQNQGNGTLECGVR